jgi:hypothetical protein
MFSIDKLLVVALPSQPIPSSCLVCCVPEKCPSAIQRRVSSQLGGVVGFGSRSQWPRGLMRGSLAARLLGSWVRIPPGAWMSVTCECCVLSGRGLCDGLIPLPEDSYRLWCVSNVCDRENRRNEEAQAHIGLSSHRKKKKK